MAKINKNHRGCKKNDKIKQGCKSIRKDRNAGQRVANVRSLKTCNKTGEHQESEKVISDCKTK